MAEDVYYTVVEGDNLTKIAKKFGKTLSYIISLNPDIKDPDYIVVGQLIRINGDPDTIPVNHSSKPVIRLFGLVSNTDNTLFATWTFDQSNVDHYEYLWTYDTGDGVWFRGNGEGDQSTAKQATYTIPSNALKVQFKVKAVSKTKKDSKGNEKSYWTGNWSTVKTFNVVSSAIAVPGTPPAPTVTIEGYTLKATLENLDLGNMYGTPTHIEFEIYKNDTKRFNVGKAKITVTGTASYSCAVSLGGSYKVRCRSIRNAYESDWSPFSSAADTPPSAPEAFDSCKAASETSVYLSWPKVANATSYEIQYTTNKTYFDTAPDQLTSVKDIEHCQYEKTGLESGAEYFFRVRAVNQAGNSDWNAISSVIIGKKPSAPTTWSSTTTAISGEEVTLYWVHNSEDGSDQTYADIEIYFNGIKEVSYTIKDTKSSYALTTHQFREGTKIEWRVRTAGVTKQYGGWSIQRTVDVYAPPTLELDITDANGDAIDVLNSFPCYVSALAGPKTQLPTGYHVVVSAVNGYETVDNFGNKKVVNPGDAVYSQYFDTSEDLLIELTPGSISLENNITYTVKSIVSMNSGLTAESSRTFTVAWADNQYEPNAEIGLDKDTYTTFIRPFCDDENGTLFDDIMLSVYRRNFDGSFTEIATGLENASETYITDPHPALDYARYRIVATSKTTGTISYCDISDYPIGGKEVVIQWDETWDSFTVFDGVNPLDPNWTGTMLKLPYNIDVADSVSPDVVLVEYIGRQHPVSYYGTQLGETSSWNVSVPKSDTVTLDMLRRLSRWMGDVYVREPSGSGYWAHVKVTHPQKHLDLVIPVTISLTRVEGGV